jgi:superfamily II DNA or RNA helicase
MVAMSPTITPRALWRPGVGLSLWFSDADGTPVSEPAADELPGPIAAQISGRTLRRRIELTMDRRRILAASLTLGPSAATDLLDALTTDDPGAELAFYRHIRHGVEAFVAAGSVVPGIVRTAGEPTLRWRPLETPTWRQWRRDLAAATPPLLRDNGGNAAVDDFCEELVDQQARQLVGKPPALRSPIVNAMLLGADAQPIPADRLAGAARAWAEWAYSVTDGESSVVLRLFEPDDEDDALLGDASDIDYWRLQVCQRSIDKPDEAVDLRGMDPVDVDQITTELAGAIRAFPALKSARHDRYSLDFLLPTASVEELLETGADQLRAAGFDVLLPRGLAIVQPRLHLRGQPVGVSRGRDAIVGFDEIRDFQWQLSIGADVLDAAELDHLANQAGDLVRVRGVWVRAQGAALTRAAKFIAAQQALAASGQPADMGELFNLVTGADDALPAPVESVEGLGWLDEIAKGGTLVPPPTEQPANLAAELRPYQRRGLDWLRHLESLRIGAVLADDMGLGKTVQVIATICAGLTADPDAGPTLIVCPMSVVGNWEREIGRFAPDLKVLVYHGNDRVRGTKFTTAAAACDVTITTFALAARDTAPLSEVPWHRLVVDEAQHVKNVATRQAKALRKIGARHRIALTGTPVENRLEDLRAVLDLVNPGMLGSPSVFKARFAESIERERDPEAVRRLTAVTSPFILRRVKTDPAIVADLPDKTELVLRTNLTVEQAALYRAVVDDLMLALTGSTTDKRNNALRRRTVLAALTRLKQVCNHPANYLADGSSVLRGGAHRSGKVELLEDLLAGIAADGERALLFTQFTAFGEILRPWLSRELDGDVPFLHGGLTRPERMRIVERFQDGDGPPALLVSLKAGGTGLNLTSANHVVHLDRWWNPAVENQATDRAHRIGQTRRVEVRKFVCVGTLEERIDQMITAKSELSDLTVSVGENWLSEIGDDELFDLMRLRDEAVSE